MEQGSNIIEKEDVDMLRVREVVRLIKWLKAMGMSGLDVYDCLRYIATGIGNPTKEPNKKIRLTSCKKGSLRKRGFSFLFLRRKEKNMSDEITLDEYLKTIMSQREAKRLKAILRFGKRPVIVTGAERTGKTTLVTVLRQRGYNVYDEYEPYVLELKRVIPVDRCVHQIFRNIVG